MHAPAKFDYLIATPETLTQYDGFPLGIPTRFGAMPGQVKTFRDATGQLWASGRLAGKFAGVFTSTGALGGGQETTIMSMVSTFVHHGIIYVPLGYSGAFKQLSNVEEVHGRSLGRLLPRLLHATFQVGAGGSAGSREAVPGAVGQVYQAVNCFGEKF